ncbi:hypothetical protein [Embleya sp. NPDC059237]|uniref:hypothetical protein n=1 Tax=Embleya sp. NPDC059237 TaxID=3346784 RepID=UPI003677F7EF
MRNTILQSLEWLARAADNPQRCLEEWNTTPAVLYPLKIGKTFDLVTVHQHVGERVLAFYDRERIPTGGVLFDPRATKFGLLVHRDTDSPPLTVALACEAVYRTRCAGLRGYLLAPSPDVGPTEWRKATRWLRRPGLLGMNTFRLDALTVKLAEVAEEGMVFPISDAAPSAYSSR